MTEIIESRDTFMEFKLDKIKGSSDNGKQNAFLHAIHTNNSFNSLKARSGVDVDRFIVKFVCAKEMMNEKKFTFFTNKKITELAAYFFGGNSSDTHQLRILASYAGKRFANEGKLANVTVDKGEEAEDVYMHDIIDYANNHPTVRKKFFDDYFQSTGSLCELDNVVDFISCGIKYHATLNQVNMWNITIPYIMEHYDSAVLYVKHFYPGVLDSEVKEYEYDDDIKPEALPDISLAKSVVEHSAKVTTKSVDTAVPSTNEKAVDPEYIDLVITDEVSKILPSDVNLDTVRGAVKMFCSIYGNMSAHVFKSTLPKMNIHLKACVPDAYIANAVCTMIEKEL
jgi:hypothetical protein